MSNLDDIRSGDTVRITIEGTVCQRTRGGMPYGRETRTVRLVVGEEGKSDAQISWDSDTVEPEITIRHTEFDSGDVAEIDPNGYSGFRRAIFVRTNAGREYWMDGSGNTWTEVATVNVRNINRVDPSKGL